MNAKPVLSIKAFKNICRTCLKTKDLFFIHEVQWDNLSLRKVLGNWISFENNFEHNMPQQICKSCLLQIINIQYFLTQMQKSQETLKDGLFQAMPSQFMSLPEPIDRDAVVLIPIKNEIIEVRIEKDRESDSYSVNNDSSFSDNNLDNNSYTEFTSEDQNIPNKSSSIVLRSKNKLIKEINKEKLEIEALRKVVTENHKYGKFAGLHGKELMYFCGFCKTGFHTHQELKMHKKLANHYKGSSFYICPYCKKELNLHSKLQEHLIKHKNEKPNLCSQCGKGFTAKSDLSRHVRNVHLKKRSLKCKFCYKLFSKTEKLKEHEATHEHIKYVCSFCGKDFKVYQYWATHERSHRKDVMRKKYEYKAIKREFQCSDCGKIYQTKQAFEEHTREHRGEIFECDICNKKFPTEGKMKKHKDFVHTDGKFTCDICGHTVKQKPNLDNHIKTVHKGEKTAYKCEHCEKVFYNKNSHKLHLRIHTNDTKYQCQICLRICTTKRNLEAHVRVHTGERPFQCSHCSKRFAAKENLGVHMRSHTGPPTFQCLLCPRAFYTNGVLRKHIRNVHNKDKDKNTVTNYPDYIVCDSPDKDSPPSKVSKHMAPYDDSNGTDESENGNASKRTGEGAKKGVKLNWFHQ